MPELFRAETNAGSDSVWVPVGGAASGQAVLDEATRQAARSVSRALASSSPFYARIIDSILDSVITPGTNARLLDETVAPVERALTWLWEDGPSALAPNARNLLRTLIVDGELILQPIVNQADGRLALDLLDPERIIEVTPAPGLYNVHSITYDDGEATKPKQLRVIQRAMLNISDLSGDIFYFRLFPVGYTAGTVRGIPLLTPCLDLISAFTEFAYKRVSILTKLATFYWEVVLEGASQEKIDLFLDSPQSAPPDGGQVFAHNERVTWKLVVPELRDISSESGFWFETISGVTGLTPEFLGKTSSRNLTSESLYTSLLHLSALQSEFFFVFRTITQYALEVACRRAVGHPKVPRFEIISTTPGSRSLQRAASSINTLANALSRAVEANLISEKEAQEALRSLLLTFGLGGEEERAPVTASIEPLVR